MPGGADDLKKVVQEFQGMVRMLAMQIHSRMPAHIELDDLIAYGQLGLTQAHRDYRPEVGTKFSTYAYYRIRGMIYDGAVKMTWMDRRHRRRSQSSQRADEFLESDAQETEGTNSNESDACWLQRMAGSLAVIYLANASNGSRSADAGDVPDSRTTSPESNLAQQETTVQLHRMIDRLPEESAKLIRCVYFEEMTLQEVATRFGISKSWASRLHARALEQLARSLRDVDIVL